MKTRMISLGLSALVLFLLGMNADKALADGSIAKAVLFGAAAIAMGIAVVLSEVRA